MIAALAALLAAGTAPVPPGVGAAPAQRGPWLDVAAGAAVLHRHRSSGVSTGPMVRLGLGLAVSDFAAGELWLAGAVHSSPRSAPGDTALAGLGVGGRLRVFRFDPEGKLALWGRLGGGWQAAAAGDARSGPTGFAGAQLLFQPFVRRFAVGLELDGLASRGSLGFAILPSLRAAL
jgi:hypothetical protein